MTTVAKLVARSLRLIQVIDARQPVKPTDMQTAIEALNAGMRRIEANGIALGWQPVSNPSDELPLPDEAEQSIAFWLANLLAAEYGVTPLPAVIGGSAAFMDDLRRDQAVATPIRPILAVPVPATTSVHSGGLVNGGYVG